MPAGDHANDDNSASDDDDNDDDVEIRDGDDDDNDDDVEIRDEDVSPTAGMPEFASAGPPAVSPDMPETAAVGLTPVSLSTLGADVDNSPVDVLLDSQPLFSSRETASSAPSRSEFGSICRHRLSRRNPAPMPEALVAIHRKATAPTPVPLGRATGDRSPIVGDPPDAPPPPPLDLGTPDPGSAT